jgi:glycosyltransferase involved in cell wall biosynthesis
MKTWTVVIPIYNDEKSLVVLLEEIKKLEFHDGLFLIVDNGSTNKLSLQPDGDKIPGVDLVRTELNLGFGGGIKFGLNKAETEWVGWMPGNLKVHPRELFLLRPIIRSNNFDFIKANRKGRSFLANFKTFGVGLIQSLILRRMMFDTGGTPTFIKKSLLYVLEDAPDDYVFESYVLFKARRFKMRIKRPKVNYGNRIFGHSHWQRGMKAEFNLLINIVRQSKKWK